MRDGANIEYRAELIRKTIHFSSLSIPILYSILSRSSALSILVPLTFIALIIDFARLYHLPTGKIFEGIFGLILRPTEKSDFSEPARHRWKRLNGATNLLIAATVCVLIFPKFIVVTSFVILIVSDSVAAVIGRRWGRRKFLAKSLEGSLAFLLSSILVVLATPKIFYSTGEYAIGVVAAVVGTFIEASSLPIDDNITLPIGVGAAMWGLYTLFYPSFPELLGGSYLRFALGL